MHAMGRIGIALCLGLATGVSRGNVMNRLYVADMGDFGKNVGFTMDLENDAPDGQVCKIGTLRAFLGVGDGKSVKYVSVGGPFHIGQLVHLTADITPSDSVFSVDDVAIHTGTAFKPGPVKATASNVPGWANGSTEYRLVQKKLTITVGSTVYKIKLPSSGLSTVLSLFENALPSSQPISLQLGQTIHVDTTVQIEGLPDISGLKPLIDKYGQVIPAKFAGKITTDASLMAAFKADDRQLQAWQARTDVDKFGGALHVPWASKGTGFFRTVKRNGFWWLVSPLGNPMFYTGVCTAPSVEWDSTPVTGRRDLFSELPPETGLQPSMWAHDVWGTHNTDYVTVHGLNLLRRFGAKNYLAKADDECLRRVSAWGFSGLGKWCKGQPKTTILPVIHCNDVPLLDKHIDAFDSAICAKLKTSLTAQISKDLKNPYILGYSYGNEYDEIITPEEVQHILASKNPSAAKKAFVELGIRLHNGAEDLRKAWAGSGDGPLEVLGFTAPAADVESLRRLYEKKYYSTLYSTFKAVDPNHLYFGCWTVPGWWVNDQDWNLIAPYVDVIGFDRYSDWPGIENLLTRFDKPVLLGEFSFPSWYGGARGFGRYSVYTESDAESGQRYATLLSAASRCRQCVGTMWFQYRDEPITGRGPATDNSVAQGEHYAFGLVDACDLPKYDLVRPVRAANLAVNATRLKETH